jgi:hypothetical protein
MSANAINKFEEIFLKNKDNQPIIKNKEDQPLKPSINNISTNSQINEQTYIPTNPDINEFENFFLKNKGNQPIITEIEFLSHTEPL